MPVLMIAVQNSVDSKDLGVATASVQLFRNLGGTIGIAVMGTILSTSIASKLKGIDSIGDGINSASLDPAMADKLAQFQNPQILLDQPKLIEIQNSLPAPIQSIFTQLIEGLREALAAALSNVFLTGVIVLVVAFVLTFFLEEIPLRTSVKHSSGERKRDQQEQSLTIKSVISK
jgi:hypothetical protein